MKFKSKSSLVITISVLIVSAFLVWKFALSTATADDSQNKEQASNAEEQLRAQIAARLKVPRVVTAAGMPTIGLESTVREKLHEFAKKPAKNVPVNETAREQVRRRMRSWAGKVMNLDKARVRESERFYRTEYAQDVTKDRQLFLNDRLGKDGLLQGGRGTEGVETDEPIRTFYRESENGDMFKLQKEKELQGARGDGLEADYAVESAKDFLTENELVQETQNDVIADVEIRQRRTAEETPDGYENDYLEQQDIVMHRHYEDKPVINSNATVGVLPEDEELALLKVNNWTPAVEGEAQTVKPEFNDIQAGQFAGNLEDQVIELLQQESRGQMTSATINDVSEGWFQHEEKGLVPVLLFEVEVDPGVSDPYEVVIPMDPLGDTSDIWNQGRVEHNGNGAPSGADENSAQAGTADLSEPEGDEQMPSES